MKTSMLSLIVLFYCAGTFAQSGSFNISFNKENFEIKHSSEYTYVDIQRSDLYYKTDPGTPAIPYLPVNFAVPYGSEFIEITISFDTILLAEEIVFQPMQPAVPIGIKKKKQSNVGPLTEIYSSSRPWPQNVVQYTSSQLMSRYQFFTFDVSPFIYLPVQKQLYLVTDLTVNVVYTGGKNTSAYNRFDDGTFYGILREEVINPEEVEPEIRDDKGTGDFQYLIITGEELKDQFQPLADWKNQIGITTDIVTVEDIYTKHHWETPQLAIKKTIQEYYQKHGTMFVLLGGNHGVVPVQRCWAAFDVGKGDNTIPADLFFACFDGTFNWDLNNNKIFGELADNVDIAPEVFITRAPVPSSYHAEIFVNKTLQYEQNPPLTDFAAEMVNFGVEVFHSYDGRNDAAWLTDQMFDEYVDPFWDGDHFSFYAMDSTGTSYNIDSSLLKSEIGKGRNFTFMASHGFPDSWKTELVSFFDIQNVYELNNASEQGLVVTIACLTNAFDDYIWTNLETTAPQKFDSCFSESFLRNPNGGAVAYHGSSRYGFGLGEPIPNLGPSFLYSAHLFNSIFTGQPHDNQYKLGAAATRSKLHLIGPSMQDGVYRWLQYTINTLGDTELHILTDDPVQLELTCPDSIPLGNSELIKIQTGIPFSRICVLNGDDLYFSNLTDATGDLLYALSPISFNPLVVTATAHNMIHAVDTIMVGEPEGDVVILQNYIMNAGENQQIEYCENVFGEITLKNIGVDTAFNTLFRITSEDDFITFYFNETLVGDIAPGESITIDSAFHFDVSCYVPNGHFIDLQGQMVSQNTLQNTHIRIIANAPDIGVEAIHLESANYNYMKPKDSTNIMIDIHNRGGADATNLRAFITSEGGDYLIYDFADTNYTILNAGEFATLHYGMYNWSEIGTEILIVNELNADHYTTVDNFFIQVIDSLENFETGDFSLYPWDLSLGDSKWVIDSMHAYNGRFCAKSGPVERFQSSILQLEMDIKIDGSYMSFYRMVSDLSGPNIKLEFYIDSLLMDAWSGRYEWAKQVYPVGYGVHTFTWKYHKIVNSLNDSADCAWIDYITFPDCTVAGLSIDESLPTDENLIVYPNPNDGTFNILSRTGLTGNTSIEIYNLQGQIVYNEMLPAMGKNSTRQIHIGDIPGGIYVIKVLNESSVWTKKLITNF